MHLLPRRLLNAITSNYRIEDKLEPFGKALSSKGETNRKKIGFFFFFFLPQITYWYRWHARPPGA